MNDIEQKALALVNEVRAERRNLPLTAIYRDSDRYGEVEALCRAIERHEAFKQEVSDAVETHFKSYFTPYDLPDIFKQFIIKPDPLVEVLLDMELSHDQEQGQHDARYLRAKLEARGLEIREKGK